MSEIEQLKADAARWNKFKQLIQRSYDDSSYLEHQDGFISLDCHMIFGRSDVKLCEARFSWFDKRDAECLDLNKAIDETK